MTIITRRSVFGLIAAGVCAPAIVRVTSIMPVRSFADVTEEIFDLAPGAINHARSGGYVVSDEMIQRFMRLVRLQAAMPAEWRAEPLT